MNPNIARCELCKRNQPQRDQALCRPCARIIKRYAKDLAEEPAPLPPLSGFSQILRSPLVRLFVDDLTVPMREAVKNFNIWSAALKLPGKPEPKK